MKKSGIRRKMIITFLILQVTLVLSYVFVTYTYTKESVTEQTIEENIKLLKKGNQVFAGYFERIDQAALIFYETKKNSSPLWVVLKSTNEAENNDEIFQAMNKIYETTEGIFQVNLMAINREISYVYKTFLLSRGVIDEALLEKEILADKEQREFKSQIDPSDATADPHTAFTKYHGYLESTHISKDYGVKHFFGEKEEVITYSRLIYEIPKDNLLAKISVDVKLDHIARLSEDLYENEQEKLYIINLDDQVVCYSSEEAFIGNKIEEAWFDRYLVEKAKGKQSFTWQGNSFDGIYVYDEIQSDYMNWVIIKEIPEGDLVAPANSLAQIILYMGLVVLVIIIIASVMISFNMTKPITELIGKIEAIKAGDMDTEIKSDRRDEYGILYDEFGEMMDSINNLIINEYKLHIENKSIELKALQAQINPHFLNNTLQLIGTEAVESGNMEVYNMLLSLSSMMRYSMRTEDNIVTVGQELDYCKAYLTFQKQRFTDDFNYELQIHPEAKPYLIPKMTLQPLIENVFYHGFKNIKRVKELILSVEMTGKQTPGLRIRIEDNGSGIEEVRRLELNQLFSYDKNVDLNYDSIGVKNVYNRLYFYYGDQVHMQFSQTDLGACLEIIIDGPTTQDIGKSDA